jgi:hypothetical protein
VERVWDSQVISGSLRFSLRRISLLAYRTRLLRSDLRLHRQEHVVELTRVARIEFVECWDIGWDISLVEYVRLSSHVSVSEVQMEEEGKGTHPFDHGKVRMSLDPLVRHSQQRIALQESSEERLGIVVEDAGVVVEGEVGMEDSAVHRCVVFAPEWRLWIIGRQYGREAGEKERTSPESIS